MRMHGSEAGSASIFRQNRETEKPTLVDPLNKACLNPVTLICPIKLPLTEHSTVPGPIQSSNHHIIFATFYVIFNNLLLCSSCTSNSEYYKFPGKLFWTK